MQDSEKAPTPPDTQSDESTTSRDTDALIEALLAACKGGKLEPLWLGPYTIHRDLGKGLYELSNKAGMVLKKEANVAQLKEYVKRAQDVSHLCYILFNH